MSDQLMQALTRAGVLMDVSVRYWRAAKKLRPEDLGLDPDVLKHHLLSLGHKKLIKVDYLHAFSLIESRAHSLVLSRTFPFLNGVARFMPNRLLGTTLNRLNKMSEEFNAERDKFLANHQQIREEALAGWSKLAAVLTPDPDRLIRTIEAAFPSVGQVRSKFAFNISIFHLKLPEKLDAVATEAGEQAAIIEARNAAADQAAREIHSKAHDFVAECVQSLRSQAAELCDEMLESMKNGKTGVHQKTLNRLIRFVDEFKGLNFVGDTQFERMLDDVKTQFLTQTAEHYRGDDRAAASLQDGLLALSNHARGLISKSADDLVGVFGKLGARKIAA